jgi:selenocysteine lyase/cysteine desulfurase
VQDAYAFPAQEWLLGPEGLGGLWVARDALERIDLTFGGTGSGTAHGMDGVWTGSLTPHPDARKLEPGLLDVDVAAATLEARGIVLRWVPQPRALRISVGFFNDEQDLARLADGLDDLTG